jgi:hypothetical protein
MANRLAWAGVLIVFLVIGCASAKKINSVALGMTPDQVVAVMGEPTSTSATENLMYFKYRLHPKSLFTEDYYIQFVDGKVDAFGRRGDFGLGY